MMFRNQKKFMRWIFFGRRRVYSSIFLLFGLVFVILAFILIRYLKMQATLINEQLEHFKRNRHLGSYIDDILNPLIEPSSTPCEDLREVPVIALVTSAPWHHEQRNAIRQTWAKELPTYFFLGTGSDPEDISVDEIFVDNYFEAKQYQDLVVFDFTDTYTNLTLKTALMMHWAMKRCPQAEFVLKTDDDVLVNPWLLQDVLKDNQDAQLLGMKIEQASLHRFNVFNKWYIPTWLYKEDVVPEYLSGTGYAINGELLDKLLKASHKVPIINLEDIFYTYLVAKEELGYALSHDRRFARGPPWIPLNCIFQNYATVYSLSPRNIVDYWNSLIEVNRNNESLDCYYYKKYLSIILYYVVFCYVTLLVSGLKSLTSYNKPASCAGVCSNPSM